MFGAPSAAAELRKREIGLSFADWSPRDVGSGRPFAERAFERSLDRAGFVGRFERRVDQDDAPALFGRHISVERDVAVRAYNAEPRIAPKRGDQRLAFVRVRLAERDAILGAHESLRYRRRTRVAERSALDVARANGFKIGSQEISHWRGWAGGQNPRDPVTPFRRALRLPARQIESARPGMGVDEPEGAFLAGQINEDAGQNDVFEHIGEIAGMKGVAIVDLNDPSIPGPPGLAPRRRRVDIDDLAALHANGAREQGEPVAHHFAIGRAGRSGDFKPDAIRLDA